MPSASEYKRAFLAISPVPPSYLGILRYHYRCPERTTSGAAIAHAIGFKDWNPVNLHYGRMGRLVGKQLGVKRTMPLPLGILVEFKQAGQGWHWKMKPQVAKALESLGWVDADFVLLPGEMPEKTALTEGTIYRVAVNAYERNPEARRLCIAHYGTSCTICGFDFGKAYGHLASDVIHVHHLLPLSSIGRRYRVNPIADLRPVCPNCHVVLHLRTPPYAIQVVWRVLEKQRGTPA